MSSKPEKYLKANLWNTDEQVVRDLVHSTIYKGKIPGLNTSRVEKRAKLPKISKAPIVERIVVKAVGEYESLGVRIKGSTLEIQVNSLLVDLDAEHLKELRYFFQRVIVGNLPRDPTWAINQIDLDHISATLFILHMLSTGIGSRVNWSHALREEGIGPVFRTTFGRTIPRPDSALIENPPEFITNARDRFNIVSFEPLRKLCAILSRKNEIQLLGRDNISSLLGIPTDTARYRTSIFDLALTERFVPHYSAMGLRQRWVQTKIEPDDYVGSRIVSTGLIGKFSLQSSPSSTAYLQLEPRHSAGPERIPSTTSFTTDFESISFRLDRFDIEKGGWNYDPWVDPERWTEKPNTWNPRKRFWLYRASEDEKKRFLKFTLKQANLMGALFTNQGSVPYRRLLIGLLGIKKTTVKKRIERLCDIGALSVLYHPLLEYSGLPEGVMLQAPNISEKDRDYLIRWIIGAMPYAHIYWGIKKSLVAVLRIPKNSTGITLGFLREYLTEGPLELPSEDFLLCSLKGVSSYTLTLPQRMFNSPRNQWRDPWIHT